MLKDTVDNLPSTPGVYLMRDSVGRIIYVGKAKNLKRRVKSYFYQTGSHPKKIKKMVHSLKDVDYILTDTEFEAFMLECRLIKEIKPLFNKKMKNSHSYAYVVIHLDDPLYRVEVTYEKSKQEGKRCFGPYTSLRQTEQAVSSLKEYYQILCTNTKSMINRTTCLNYSLGLCIGTCLGEDEAIKKHNLIVKNIISLLDGTDLSLMKELEDKMALYAEKFEFEMAAKLRDCLDIISYLLKKEEILEFTLKNHNILIIEFLNKNEFKLFLIKRNTILYNQKFLIKDLNLHLMCTLIKDVFSNTSEIFLDEVNKEELDASHIIYSYLKSGQCQYIIIPNTWLFQPTTFFIEEAITARIIR